MISRDYQEITILIPGYSIEDLPTDLNERSAASLLNAFAVAWHPHLLVRSKSIPQFRQAESTEMPTARQIVLVPECSEDWLGQDWQTQLADQQSVFVNGCSERAEWLSAISERFPAEEVPSDLLKDFFALGTCHLQVMLLSRRMHYFVDPDRYLLESEAMSAADAAIAGDAEKCRDHLRRCFECLQECREQFQPMECFLVDICLPSDQSTSDELTELITIVQDVTLICCGAELRRHCEASADFLAALCNSTKNGSLSLMTGQENELRTSLGSLSTLYSDIQTARTWIQGVCGEIPVHWARRRFGMTSALPAVLSLFGFNSALHVALDDGLYPDRERGQMQWQGPDGTTIPATSRIPLAIEGASSFLRFADRFTESMQEDSVPVMLLARLPNVQSPWLGDLRAAAEYAPVLGRFVTMTEFVDRTEGQAGVTQYDDGEYLSPYLIQSSVLKTEQPIQSPASLHLSRTHLETVAAIGVFCAILRTTDIPACNVESLENELNAEEAARLSLDANDEPDRQAERLDGIGERIEAAQNDAMKALLQRIPAEAADVKGLCLVNPLPWKRTAVVQWPQEYGAPKAVDAISEARQQEDSLYVQTEIPAGGMTWLIESGGLPTAKPLPTKGKPLAEDFLLRNKYFEVKISESTGGISSVTFHNERANRVSQQLAFRYENSKRVKQDDGQEVATSYAAPILKSTRILQTGPMIGAIETTSEIADVVTQKVMARYRQTVTVERNSSRILIAIDFDDISDPPKGNPWMTYFGSRFAWENESASITRGVLGQARGFRMERFESPDYLEIADSDTRVVIVPHGRPYHRRSGHRMLDSLLIVEGESQRSFLFTLDFNHPYPMRVATEVLNPVVRHMTVGSRPTSFDSSWILGLSAKNVIVARMRVEARPAGGNPTHDSRQCVILLLEETEGRSATCTIHTARRPTAAHLRQPNSTVVQELSVTEKGVDVNLSRFQIKEVALIFG